MTSRNLYNILEVAPSASQEEIKSAYRRLAMLWHPDRNPNNRKEAEERFKEIAYAYSVLSDPQTRASYDEYLIKNNQDNAFSQEYSSEEALNLFLSNILDICFKLSRAGYDENFIATALIKEGCPESIARTLAKQVSSAAKGATSDNLKPLNESTSAPVSSNAPSDDFTWGLYSKGVWLVLVGTIIGIFEQSSGYYSFLHFAFFSMAVFGAFLVGKSRHGLTFLLVLMAFLYNPITGLTLGKGAFEIWVFINIISLVLLFYTRHVLRTGDIKHINATVEELEEEKSSPVPSILEYIVVTIIGAPIVLWFLEDKINAPWSLSIYQIIVAGLVIGVGIALFAFLCAWIYRLYVVSSGGSYRQVRLSLPSGYQVCAIILGLATVYGYYQLMDGRKNVYNQQVAYDAQMKLEADARVKAENEARLNQQRQAAHAAEIPSQTSGSSDPRTDSLIAQLELTYPVFNPKSAAYSQQTVDDFIDRWKKTQNSGMAEYDALLYTAQEYAKEEARRNQVVKTIDSKGGVSYSN